jgi:hypothetical protein
MQGWGLYVAGAVDDRSKLKALAEQKAAEVSVPGCVGMGMDLAGG